MGQSIGHIYTFIMSYDTPPNHRQYNLVNYLLRSPSLQSVVAICICAGKLVWPVGEDRRNGIVEENIFHKCPLLFVIQWPFLVYKTMILQMLRAYSAQTGGCECFPRNVYKPPVMES